MNHRVIRASFLLLVVSFIIATVAVISFAPTAHAASVIWKDSLSTKEYKLAKKGPGNWYFRVKSPNFQVQYGATVSNLSTGQVYGTNIAIPNGTRLAFRFDGHSDKHISWSASGGISDTPYGEWRSGASRPGDLCSNLSGYIAQNGGKGDGRGYVQYVVDPPSKSISGLGGVSCSGAGNNGLNCTMNEPGTYTVRFNFSSTAGKLWIGATYGRGSCHGSTDRSANVSAQSITYRITVIRPPEDNKPPVITNFSSVGACVADQTHTLSFTATDADNDKIRYLIDWNNNGIADQIVPPSGYVNSGTTQTATRVYATAGSKTVQVLAEDDFGKVLSTWSSLTFDCAPPAGEAQCSDLIDNDGDGLIDADDPDCLTDPNDPDTYNENDDNEETMQCADGIDNDGDGLIDLNDPDCEDDVTDDSEATPIAQCADGTDNDRDGFIDLDDPNCSDSADVSEFAALPPPPPIKDPDLTLRAIPSLVREGSTTRVHWTATNVLRCTVTGDNGDSWTGISSGVSGEKSSPITERTVYTLVCTDFGGKKHSKDASVKILPVWREI